MALLLCADAAVRAAFASGVPAGFVAEMVTAEVRGAFFVPAAALKELRRAFWAFFAPKLAAALRAQLAAKGPFTVAEDDSVGAGFSVKVDKGRVESSFTAEAISAELARRLRPDLAKLLKA